MATITTGTAGADNDLDAFLTLLESKLRGPFSSLDLAKSVAAAAATTTAASSAPRNSYLQNVLAVLPRAEKVTQLRCIVGLLGLVEPVGTVVLPAAQQQQQQDAAVTKIVEAAQEAPVYEEWVRIVAGLVQGILFQSKEDEEQDDDGMQEEKSAVAAAKGEEAKQLLEKTCTEILDRVRKVERETVVIDEDSEHLLAQSDADPLFAPYRYALLHPDLLQAVIPEVKAHDHFHVNESADILFMDAKLEVEKLKEEQEHQHQAGLNSTAVSTEKQQAALKKAPDAPDFPGFRNNSSSKPKAATVQRPKSSMFMPAKPPAGGTMAKRPLALGTGGARPAASSAVGSIRKPGTAATTKTAAAAGLLKPVVKPVLHQRKAGAAQSLLAKGRRSRLINKTAAGNSSTNNSSAQAGEVAAQQQQHRSTTTTTTPSPTVVLGRTAVMAAAAANRSGGAQKYKMKMIDVNEVQGLETKKQEAVAAAALPPAKRGRKAQLVSGSNKRGKSDTSDVAGNEKVSRLKKNDTSAVTNGDAGHHTKPTPPVARAASPHSAVAPTNPTQTTTAAAGALASAALLAYQQFQQLANNAPASVQQQQQQRPAPQTPVAAAATAAGTGSGSRQQDWREMLQLRSNRLSEEDRLRVQHFFVHHFNPTPEQTIVQLKLHEERTTDAKTGDPVKVTYYLKLDYSNFTSTQSKKVKRYTEDH